MDRRPRRADLQVHHTLAVVVFSGFRAPEWNRRTCERRAFNSGLQSRPSASQTTKALQSRRDYH